MLFAKFAARLGDRRRAAERHIKVAAAPSTVGIIKRLGGGGVLPKSLMSGSGQNLLECFGSQINARHKLP